MNTLFYSGAAPGGGRRASAFLFALAIFVNVLPTEQTKADLSSQDGELAAAAKSTSSMVRREVPSEPVEGPIELFDAFVAGHGHGYVRGTAEYELRRGRFAQSIARFTPRTQNRTVCGRLGSTAFPTALKTSLLLTAAGVVRTNRGTEHRRPLSRSTKLHEISRPCRKFLIGRI